MSRGAQVFLLLLLVVVVGMGGLLVARNRQADRAGENGAQERPAVMVYTPCGLQVPITVANAQFRAANPGVKLDADLDNANILVRRIKDGERPDVFISPGEIEMKGLVAAGIIDPTTVTDFGTLDLVLIAPKKTKGLNRLDDLKSPGIKTISLADPRYNSIGYYGSEALKKLGLWEAIQSKLILREAPLEAVTLATDGQVDAGITFLTCPLETAPEKADASNARIVQTIPRDAYPPVRLQLGILKESRNREAAQRYLDFMTSEAGQKAVSINGIQRASEIK